ncbi:MAG: sigma-70 family RNA polymerase sigma factor [Nannocystaceae bacterium]
MPTSHIFDLTLLSTDPGLPPARILIAVTDAVLLQAWCDGDRSAGEELFERHYPTVERFFRNKVAEPDDLIQRTFLACMEAASRFRGESRFRTFLLGIATNILRTHYRTLKQQRGIASLHTSTMADLGQTPSRIIANHEQERLLLAALRRLPIELQLVLELRYWDDLKHEELAEILELPRSTVNTRLRRARELLEGHLSELAASPQQLHTTVTKLADWVEQQRMRGGPLPPNHGED